MLFLYGWLLLSISWAFTVSSHYNVHDDPGDTTWAIQPDLTHDELLAHGFEIPEIASPVTEIKRILSYIVKFDCLGCPFDIRDAYIWDQYEQPGRPNSLLLNFTLTSNQLSLLLNGRRVYPLQPQTSGLRAYQVEANASKELIGKIADYQMLDESWRLGTRFGTYDLSFDETLQSARGSRRTHLTFDIAGMSYWHDGSRHNFLLDAPEQQIVRLVLEQEQFRPRLQIKDIQLLGRCEARPKDMEKPCRNIRSSLLHSSNSLHRVSFRDWEWDRFGKLGSFVHGWNHFWWTADHHPFLFMFLAVLIVAVARKLVVQVHRRGFRYLRRSNGDLEEVEVEEMSPQNIGQGNSQMKRARSPLSITIRSKM